MNNSKLLSIAVCLVMSPVFAGPIEDATTATKRGDYATAIRILKPLADKGNAEAQFRVGLMYADGSGVPKDDQQALHWLIKAGEQNNGEACAEIGRMYRNVIRPNDPERAVQWFRKSADLGDAWGQFHLGEMYAYGAGVAKDERQAKIFLHRAAEQGVSLVTTMVAQMYARGVGLQKDDQQAYLWYSVASIGGNTSATRNRDRIESILTDEQRAAANSEFRRISDAIRKSSAQRTSRHPQK